MEANIWNQLEVIAELKIDKKGEVHLVRNKESKVIYVRKTFKKNILTYEKLLEKKYKGIPEIIEVNYDGERLLVLEEYIAGKTLQEILDEKNSLQEKDVLEITYQLCEVLKALHSDAIIHRDIKPSNIIYTEKKGIKLIDFDAARILKEEQKHDTCYLGTKGYAPPEQYGFAQTDARTDIYALGVTIKELLGESYQGKLLNIIKKCCEIDPNRRYKSVKELQKSINEILHPLKRNIRFLLIFITAIILIGAASFTVNNSLNDLFGKPDIDNIHLRYVVNQSEENLKGNMFEDGEGEWCFSQTEELLDSTYNVSDLWPQARYINYTIPETEVFVDLVNSDNVPLKNPKIEFSFKDMIVWDLFWDHPEDSPVKYEGHIHGVGAYTKMIWENKRNIRPSDKDEFTLYFAESAIIGEEPTVEVKITSDNCEPKSFNIPISLEKN